MSSNINYLRKQAGLPPLAEVTQADITRALDAVMEQAVSNTLSEDLFSNLKAVLATVGQPGSKAGKAAADKAKKLPGTLRKLYKEPETKDQLRILYKQFNVMLNTMAKITTETKDLQEKDPEVRKEIELFTTLLHRTIDTLQARAGISVKVKEEFEADELPALLEAFLAEEAVEEPPAIDEADQLDEAKYVSAAEFSDNFYALLNSLKSASADVSAKKAKIRNWLRREDFANSTQADEMFDLFLTKFDAAMTALRSCDTHLQKKLK